jgi:hypothetical protein
MLLPIGGNVASSIGTVSRVSVVLDGEFVAGSSRRWRAVHYLTGSNIAKEWRALTLSGESTVG